MPIKTSSNTSITKIYGKTAGKHLSQSSIPPINFHSNTDNISYNLFGNMTQASTQEYSITDIPPIDFMSDGNGLSDYEIYGNMQQIGQPAPDAPITPEECGDKTENLFDINSTTTDENGNTCNGIELPAGKYCITNNSNAIVYWRIGISITSSSQINPSAPYVYINANDTLVIWVGSGNNGNIMVNSGSVALPYEPYNKYKIQVTNAGTTTNIYTLEPIRKIGDYADIVDSTGTVTRQIGKKVLTGTEIWIQTASNYFYSTNAITDDNNRLLGVASTISTHYKIHKNSVNGQGLANYEMCMFSTTGVTNYHELYIRDENYADADAFKAFLAQEYANGNPVTVWYVLATATTESITSPTISTVSGSNTLSTGTTLQPSYVSLTTSSSVYPLNPIIPEEVGERTRNLCPNTGWMSGQYRDGVWEDTNSRSTSDFFPVEAKQYRLKITSGQLISFINLNYFDNQKQWLGNRATLGMSAFSPTAQNIVIPQLPSNAAYMKITIRFYNDDGNPPVPQSFIDDSNIMVSEGTSEPSYEPYGYAIPLNLNNTISNIYLSQPIRKIGNYSDIVNDDGTVTRQIKQIDLGDLTWGITASGNFSSQELLDGIMVMNTQVAPAMCSHFQIVKADSYGSTPYSACGSINSVCKVSINKTGYEGMTAIQFKNAMSGIKYWYALATPEVEQITPPTITPSIESNTISVDTTLQPSNLSITYTSPDYSEIKLVYDNQGNILYNDPPYHDWGAVRWIVRQGLGSQYYPVGYIFYDNFNSSTGTAYQVVAHNHHFDPNLTALGYTYSMTCLEVKLNDYMIFDNAEAFLYTDTIIPAGTYRFTIPNYDATYGGNKTYYFTATADLPVGSQIVINWPYQQTPKTVTAYSPSGTTMVQTITTATTGWNGLTLTEYVDGTSPTATDLGTIAGSTTQSGSSNYGQMNHIHRARYGSNNYLQSGIRQYLNSNSDANTWWQPQTIFDRPYGGRTFAGKLTKLNQNLVDVLATPTIQSRTNQYFETTSLDGTTFSLSTNYDITTDKLFLLSPMEINFNTTDTTVGTVLDYYVDATNADRIKIRTSTGAAGTWWLRTPYPTGAYGVRYVGASGALGSYNAYNSCGCAPAWVIQ